MTKPHADADQEPPDDWDPEDVAPSPDARAEAVRRAWIAGVRAHYKRFHGTECNYTSNAYWDGRRDKVTGRQYKPKWPSIVTKAAEYGIDPVVLVTVLFESLTSDSMPTPYAIVAPENIDRYRRREPTRAAAVATAVRSEEEAFRTALWAAQTVVVDPHRAVRHALNDMGRPLSPLFRYCMAALTKHADIADRWRAAAVEQFLADEAAYLIHWVHLLPPDLATTARAG